MICQLLPPMSPLLDSTFKIFFFLHFAFITLSFFSHHPPYPPYIYISFWYNVWAFERLLLLRSRFPWKGMIKTMLSRPSSIGHVSWDPIWLMRYSTKPEWKFVPLTSKPCWRTARREFSNLLVSNDFCNFWTLSSAYIDWWINDWHWVLN